MCLWWCGLWRTARAPIVLMASLLLPAAALPFATQEPQRPGRSWACVRDTVRLAWWFAGAWAPRDAGPASTAATISRRLAAVCGAALRGQRVGSSLSGGSPHRLLVKRVGAARRKAASECNCAPARSSCARNGPAYEQLPVILRAESWRFHSVFPTAYGLATVGVVAAVSRWARLRIGRRGPAPRYVLQLSRERVELAPGESKNLTATAWRVLPKGGYTAAPEARVRLRLTPPSGDLHIEPTVGQGSCRSRISAGYGAREGEFTVAAEATAEGVRATASALVVVRASHELELFPRR